MVVEYMLKCRLPWFRYPKASAETISTDIELYENMFCPKIKFNNSSFCANNKGLIHIEYSENISKEIIYKNAYTLLSFISLCIGTIAQYEPWIKIDNIIYPNFFNFPTETTKGYTTFKDVKFWEFGFEDLIDIFPSILEKLFCEDNSIISSIILPNYLASTYYIDFIGSLEWKFLSAVTTIESLMSYINSESYAKKEKEFKIIFDKLKNSVPDELKKDFKKLTIRRVNLQQKIIDAINLGEIILNTKTIKTFDKGNYAKKCATTRNNITHYLDNSNNSECFTTEEMSNARTFLITLSRIILLYKLCPTKNVSQRFKRNSVLRQILNCYNL